MRCDVNGRKADVLWSATFRICLKLYVELLRSFHLVYYPFNSFESILSTHTLRTSGRNHVLFYSKDKTSIWSKNYQELSTASLWSWWLRFQLMRYCCRCMRSGLLVSTSFRNLLLAPSFLKHKFSYDAKANASSFMLQAMQQRLDLDMGICKVG